MDEYTVTYYPQVNNDLKDIYTYLIDNDVAEKIASKQINDIRATIRALSFFPLRHESVTSDRLRNAGMRKVPVNNYVVFYSVDELNHIVNVVRVFYHGMNLDHIINSDKFLLCERNLLGYKTHLETI